ncbi:MAG: histidinol phosphate phosphatase domain-containing protein [Candidatus Omnitrophota bacterium]
MIDLHTHSILSDGALLPSELVRRAEIKGYRVMAITDHADISNLDFILPRIIQFCLDIKNKTKIKVIPGVELTHIQPGDFKTMVKKARELGAAIVIGHGETIVEPVVKGTNRAAIEAGVDILAHPGIIEESDAELALNQGVFLEISARAGHCLGNGHVAKTALKIGTKLVINTDSHIPENLITREQANSVCQGAGLDPAYIVELIQNTEIFIEKIWK